MGDYDTPTPALTKLRSSFELHKNMVDLDGIEPPCDQLRFLRIMSARRYKSFNIESVKGVEPPLLALEGLCFSN